VPVVPRHGERTGDLVDRAVRRPRRVVAVRAGSVEGATITAEPVWTRYSVPVVSTKTRLATSPDAIVPMASTWFDPAGGPYATGSPAAPDAPPQAPATSAVVTTAVAVIMSRICPRPVTAG
jgi:hypothetical protein